MSRQKAGYIRSLAELVLSGELDLHSLPADDEEAIALLTKIKGIGRWSAEIYLLFAEGRSDVFPAGDLAVMDDEGYVNIVGRIKDMIIRGGENIYPREVEEFLYSHPDIADVQVIGVPSERYGEEVMAWVKLRDGASAGGEEIAAWCKGKIASYKIPRHWKFVDAFPMTVTGKVQKFKMRETAVEELGLVKAAEVRTA